MHKGMKRCCGCHTSYIDVPQLAQCNLRAVTESSFGKSQTEPRISNRSDPCQYLLCNKCSLMSSRPLAWSHFYSESKRPCVLFKAELPTRPIQHPRKASNSFRREGLPNGVGPTQIRKIGDGHAVGTILGCEITPAEIARSGLADRSEGAWPTTSLLLASHRVSSGPQPAKSRTTISHYHMMAHIHCGHPGERPIHQREGLPWKSKKANQKAVYTL